MPLLCRDSPILALLGGILADFWGGGGGYEIDFWQVVMAIDDNSNLNRLTPTYRPYSCRIVTDV